MAVSNQARSPRAIFCSRATVLAACWCASDTSYNGCWPPIHDSWHVTKTKTGDSTTVHSQSTDSSVQQHGSQTANPASQSTNCYFDSFSHHQHQRQIVMNFSGNTQHSSLAMAIGYPLVQGVERCGLKNGWENRKTAHITSLPQKWCKGLWWLHDHPRIQVPNNHGPPLPGGFQPKTECVNAVRWRVGQAITKCR